MTESNGALSFGGTATGDIATTFNDGVFQFVRSGITLQSPENSSITSIVTPTGNSLLMTNATASQITTGESAVSVTSIKLSDKAGVQGEASGISFPSGTKYQLSNKVGEYVLANQANRIELAQLEDQTQRVVGGNQTDIFSGNSLSVKGGGTSASPTGLILDGGAGRDELRVTLSESVKFPDYAPKLTSVEKVLLSAQPNGANDTVGLMFSRATGVEEIWNVESTANLTVTDIRNKIKLGVAVGDDSGLTDDALAAVKGRDFAVRYGESVNPIGTQELVLHNADVNLLTLTKLHWTGSAYENVSAGITTLNIASTGVNAIASFDEKSDGSSIGTASLADSLRTINVTGEGGLSLNLAEIKAMQVGDTAFERVTTDLTNFSVGSGDSLNLKAADLSQGSSSNWIKTDLGNGKTETAPKSIHTIKLPPLDSIAGDISIDNLTIASTTGYTHAPVQNDVVDLTSWNVTSTELAGLVKSITISKGADLSSTQPYVNFVLAIENGDNDFTLALNNLVSKNVYNTMLYALETVETTEDLKKTTDLVEWLKVEDNKLATVFSGGSAFSGKTFETETETVTFTNAEGADGEAVVALVGLMVNEGTFAGVPLLSEA